MKFIWATTSGINFLISSEIELLVPTSIDRTTGRIKKEEWGKYWIFEADENYALYTAIRHNWVPVMLEDFEYAQLLVDGTTFIDKERRAQLVSSLKRETLINIGCLS